MFNFKWFKSAERKRLEEENALLRSIIEGQPVGRKTETIVVREESRAVVVVEEKPYKNIYFSNGIVTAVLGDGTVLSKEGDKSLIDSILKAKDANGVVVLFIAKPVEEIKGAMATEEEKQIIKETSHVLETTGDFEFKDGGVFLKECNLKIPEIVLASFIEFTERKMKEEYDALKMFWLWTSLNPIENSRNDLFNFIRDNDVVVTKNGLLELYRRIEKVGEGDKKLIEFVSANYTKMKKWKKSPRNYIVSKTKDGDFKLNKMGEGDKEDVFIENLENIYLDLPNLQENTYTDAYTHTKVIKLGAIYSEDEDKIDLNNNEACSNGLHVGSKTFGFDGNGNTGVLALVNPMKVRAVPTYATNKMRVSEMFIVGIMKEKEFKEGEQNGVADFASEYCNSTIEELASAVKGKDFTPISCQNNQPALSLLDVGKVMSELQQRIVKI